MTMLGVNDRHLDGWYNAILYINEVRWVNISYLIDINEAWNSLISVLAFILINVDGVVSKQTQFWAVFAANTPSHDHSHLWQSIDHIIILLFIITLCQ